MVIVPAPSGRGARCTSSARRDEDFRAVEDLPGIAPCRSGYSRNMAEPDQLPVVADLEELSEMVRQHDAGRDLYVRWSPGPSADACSTSRDALTGVQLPGLSANPLRVEEWWGDRSLRFWVARRLYDYQHLRDRQPGVGVRAWLLRGREVARGPDNEPLVSCDEPLAWVAESAMQEAHDLVSDEHEGWGPLDRRP